MKKQLNQPQLRVRTHIEVSNECGIEIPMRLKKSCVNRCKGDWAQSGNCDGYSKCLSRCGWEGKWGIDVN